MTSGLVHLLSALALLVLLQARSSEADGEEVDVLAYDLDLTIEEEQVQGTVSLAVRSEQPVQRLDLTLASSVELISCTLKGRNVPFTRSSWDLGLDLLAAGQPQGNFSLVFEIVGRPYNQQSNNYVRTVISKEHAYIRSQYAWYPRRDGDLALYDTRLSVKSGWTARTAGDLQETHRLADRTIWHYVLKQPCTRIGLAAGEYASVARETGGEFELNALVFKGSQAAAKALLDVAAESIRYYTQLFGPMSERHFTLVEMPPAFGPGSGYGETGYALIGSGAFENSGEAAWAQSLVAHEVSHTWWGREVVFSDFGGEMLATYSTLRFLERFKGAGAARDERRRFVNRITETAAGAGLASLDSIRGFGGGLDMAVYSVCAYDKAALLLHALEREMGRKPFDTALKRLFQKNRGQTMAYADVKSALPGNRFAWLFAQWERAEIPELRLEHELKRSRSKTSVTGRITQQGTSQPFRMQVTLRASSGERSVDHAVELKQNETSFKFDCPFEPDQLVIDPESDYVFAQAGIEDPQALEKSIFAVVNSPKAADPSVLRRTIKNLQRVIADSPEPEAAYHTGLGRCLFRLGELEQAQTEFETALKGGAGGPFHRTWVNLRLGCIADLQKDRKSAKAHYEKVLAADSIPNHEYQQKLAARFLERPYRGYAQDG